jgi:diadenosine tetraphosphate (Ap4A) HIT family hydrolase
MRENTLNKSDINARAAGWYDDEARRARESGKCIFCHPKDKYVVARESDWYLTTNKFPRSQANLLVIPDRHIEHVHDLTPEDAIARLKLEQLGQNLLSESYGITDVWFLLRDGLGGEAAGKTVAHLHSHIVLYYHGILLWESDRAYPDRVHRTPEEAGWPILPAVEVAQTLRDTLVRRREVLK